MMLPKDVVQRGFIFFLPSQSFELKHNFNCLENAVRDKLYTVSTWACNKELIKGALFGPVLWLRK